jgi:hypothetical protein
MNASTTKKPLLARLPCPGLVADDHKEEQVGPEEEESFSAEDECHVPDPQYTFVTDSESEPPPTPPPPTLVYCAFSSFLGVKWSHLGIQDWAKFIESRFFTIVYATLTQTAIAENEVADLLAALIQPLQFLSCEDWATASQRFAERTLTSEILAAILSFEPTPDLMSLLSSLIRLTDEASFSEYAFSEIREWLEAVLTKASPDDLVDGVWFLLRSLASAPFASFFEWFCGDLESLSDDPDSLSDDPESPSGDPESPYDVPELLSGDGRLFSGDTKSLRHGFQEFPVSPEASFLLTVCLGLVGSAKDAVICSAFFQFLVLVWDGCPESHLLFRGVQGFLDRCLLQSKVPTLPHLSLGLLARCAAASNDPLAFPPPKLFDCLGWEETSPDAAFALAGLVIDREYPGWEAYLDDSALAGLGRLFILGNWHTKEPILTFLCKLVAVSQSHSMAPDPFSPFAHIVFDLWVLSVEDSDELHGFLRLLARGFVAAGILEDEVSAIMCPFCSGGRIWEVMCPHCSGAAVGDMMCPNCSECRVTDMICPHCAECRVADIRPNCSGVPIWDMMCPICAECRVSDVICPNCSECPVSDVICPNCSTEHFQEVVHDLCCPEGTG